MEEPNEDNGRKAKNESFGFSGTAAEYFAIWVVNVALTILTLGIYSAWAKVRTQQYFYGNTSLDGVSFRYTASPLQILKGRVIAFAALLLYSSISNMGPLLAASALVILMLPVPAFMVMSMAFRLRNSSYRNVRFSFEKNYLAAYKIFAIPVAAIGVTIFLLAKVENGQALYPIMLPALILAMALMYPWWEFLLTQFKVEHANYGRSEFNFTAATKDYYVMYLKMYGLLLLVFVLLYMLSKASLLINLPALQLIVMLMLVPVYFWVFAYLQAKRANLLYNNISINGNKVKSKLKVSYLLYLYVTNTLAMMLSLGLLMPWAKVRTAKYRASVTSVDVIENFSQFLTSEGENQSALGEEMGEMFDMDLGF